MISVRAAAVVLRAGHCLAAGAQDLQIDHVKHFTENRGWTEAGLGPTYQIVEDGTIENRSLTFSDPYTPPK